MRMGKKGIVGSLVLAASLTLAGCGGQSTDNAASTATPSAPSTASGVSSAPASGSKLNTQLKFLSYQDNFDPETDYERQAIKDMLGVDIVPTMGNDDDKVNLILSSGQDYDMISMNNRNLLAMYAKNKAIQPLTTLIDQYGPNLKNAFTQEEWDMVSVDGEIYALPTFNYEAVTDGLIIRKDWLDKLGLPMPTTPDELYQTLKAFKEQDPGGVGKDNVIPFAYHAGEDGNLLEISGLAEAFGLGRGPTDFIEQGGKIVSGLDTPGAKEYIAYLNKLNKEDLLDPDAAASKHDKVMEKVGAGYVGAATMSCWDSGAVRALKESDPNAELAFLPPMKDPNGNQKISGTGGLYSFVIVPQASKKAADVVQYANAFLDPANYTKLILGDENVTYKVEDGKYYPIFPAFDKLNKGRWFYPVNESKMYTPLFGARARKEPEMAALWDDINAKADSYVYTPVVNQAPVVQAEQDFGQQLRTFSHEQLIKMMLDDSSLAKFDDFVKQWKEKGGQALADQYNEWYQTTK
ncbi:extracellular solute-binding protein [Cohnella zeiphila]|uniref:Extracellular solute-binding protein n=1 Tax=Cohnella zeiphila TaxID=2761120 RepID=A0A7X0STV0_9BACL|nr:extracellular solute-binding protein [Cohnella zeiphila]MBB6734790.1 extracellular solute-binding protein [Cohnella zeiphila]